MEGLQGGREQSATLRLRTASGNSLLVDVSATPLFGPAGTFTGLLCLVTDHSRRRPLELELDQRRAFAQSLLDSSTDCIKQLGLDGRLQSINQRGLDVMGTNDPATLQGQPWTSFLGPAEARVAEAALDRARAGQVARCQIELQTCQGELRWTDVVVSPIRQPGGPVESLLVISRDMTELLGAQQRERVQAQKYVQILESITDAFYALDHDWTFTYVNAQAARLLKRSPAELVSQDVWEAFPEAVGTIIEDKYRQVMGDRVAEEQAALLEQAQRRHRGDRLRHREDAKDRIEAHRRRRRRIARPDGTPHRQLAASHDQRDRTWQPLTRHQPPMRLQPLSQPRPMSQPRPKRRRTSQRPKRSRNSRGSEFTITPSEGRMVLRRGFVLRGD